MTAKSAPYPPCTVTAFWLKYQDPARMLRRVTQPPDIAGPLGGIARAKQGPVFSREFIVTHNFRSSIGTHSSANFVLTCPACSLSHLHMIIHGFAFWKFAKPVHKHHLQVLPPRKPGFVPSTGT